MPSHVTVKESCTHGLGVFATSAFMPGELILLIDDSYVIDQEHPVPAGEETHCDYLESGKVVWMQSPERHINHSCDPNAFVRTVAGVRQVVALKQISEGEEIGYDYCVNGFGDTVWNCTCSAPSCRKTIHSDFFHLPISLQLEYLPLLDDWFQAEYRSKIQKLESARIHPSQ
jgi:hypothetical protein